jgi:hypothetical protein
MHCGGTATFTKGLAAPPAAAATTPTAAAAAAAAGCRLLPSSQPADEETSALSLQLLDLLAPDLADTQVTRVMDGERLCHLVVVLSKLRPKPSRDLVDPLIRELLRYKGNKVPRNTPGEGETGRKQGGVARSGVWSAFVVPCLVIDTPRYELWLRMY